MGIVIVVVLIAVVVVCGFLSNIFTNGRNENSHMVQVTLYLIFIFIVIGILGICTIGCIEKILSNIENINDIRISLELSVALTMILPWLFTRNMIKSIINIKYYYENEQEILRDGKIEKR